LIGEQVIPGRLREHIIVRDRLSEIVQVSEGIAMPYILVVEEVNDAELKAFVLCFN
jgi:hypothetical protein